MGSAIELRTEWLRLWQELGAAGDGGERFEELVRRYEGRAYHNLSHVQACLEELAGVVVSHEIAFALWYHDAVYDSREKDNEARSAALACTVAGQAGLGEAFCDAVTRLILATRHGAPPLHLDEQIMVDVDLSILGQEWDRFEAYERAIRQEYAWVAEAAFGEGRRAVLEGFLRRERIFSTAHFHGRYEVIARENLARSLRLLAGKV